MDEWSADGRRIATYKVDGEPAVWSEEPVPRLLRAETFDMYGWRLAVRVSDGERRPGPDSGPVFTTREAAKADAELAREENPSLIGLPIVEG